MTQLSNVLITDNSTYYQNKLSVIKTSDNCVFSKADLRSIKVAKMSLILLKVTKFEKEPHTFKKKYLVTSKKWKVFSNIFGLIKYLNFKHTFYEIKTLCQPKCACFANFTNRNSSLQDL